jgi:hypothetical protein
MSLFHYLLWLATGLQSDHRGNAASSLGTIVDCCMLFDIGSPSSNLSLMGNMTNNTPYRNIIFLKMGTGMRCFLYNFSIKGWISISSISLRKRRSFPDKVE